MRAMLIYNQYRGEGETVGEGAHPRGGHDVFRFGRHSDEISSTV